MAGAGSANNVFSQASGALTGAMAGTREGMKYQPQNVQAAQAVGGINTYMNPYTQQVIDTSMADLERQRQMQMNQLGAQATQARAFGGSRQGVAEALSNEAFARQGGQLAAGLRQQGYQTALGAAQQDVANQLQASLNNQQAGLQGAQLRLGAANQLGSLGQMGFNQGMAITEQQMRQGAMQQQAQQQLIDAARGQYQNYVGAPQQSLALPLQALGAAPVPQTTTQSRKPGLFDYLTLAATAASGTNFTSDPRLKTNVQHKGQFNGVNFYSWDWNDEGKRVANPAQPTFGVMADELQKTHPQHVVRGDDGYLRVKYSELMRELVEAA